MILLHPLEIKAIPIVKDYQEMILFRLFFGFVRLVELFLQEIFVTKKEANACLLPFQGEGRDGDGFRSSKIKSTPI